jgi:hypothetical protein
VKCENKFSAKKKTTVRMKIEPSEAMWILANRNAANRNLQPTAKETLANLEEMLNGVWDPDSAKATDVIFNKELMLREGQHRCFLVIITGQAQEFDVVLFSPDGDLRVKRAEIKRRAAHQFDLTARSKGHKIPAGFSNTNRDFASRVYGAQKGETGARVIGNPFGAYEADQVARNPDQAKLVLEMSEAFAELKKREPEIAVHLNKSSQRVLHSAYADTWIDYNREVADKLFAAVFGESKLLKQTGIHARGLFMEIMAKRKVNENGIKTDADSVDRAIMSMLMELAKIVAQPKLKLADTSIPRAGGIFKPYREKFNLPLR